MLSQTGLEEPGFSTESYMGVLSVSDRLALMDGHLVGRVKAHHLRVSRKQLVWGLSLTLEDVLGEMYLVARSVFAPGCGSPYVLYSWTLPDAVSQLGLTFVATGGITLATLVARVAMYLQDKGYFVADCRPSFGYTKLDGSQYSSWVFTWTDPANRISCFATMQFPGRSPPSDVLGPDSSRDENYVKPWLDAMRSIVSEMEGNGDVAVPLRSSAQQFGILLPPCHQSLPTVSPTQCLLLGVVF